ncbi:MAG: T9SS type A sorting domain-containing protein [Chitinophagales bacterium]|nr:T9SS type A sorting domain-containing protein [Chitinophagales bacterium]MDW8419645.1 T9SS type A sorting domain-containing protein [Chitinophagales bacterium]
MKLLYTLAIITVWQCTLYAQLNATISSVNPTCAGNNGSATVTATGGTNYTYKWSTGATTPTITGLGAGTYTVTVYSAGGVKWDTVYFETFEGAHNWTLNTPTGTNGTDNNYWVVSDAESGMPPGSCSAGYMGNQTLHVTSVSQFLPGATYDAGGLCGLLYCPQTNMAATSPNISTVGKTNLVLRIDFIGGGQGTIDNASLHLSNNGGTTFNTLDNSLKSSNSGCGSGEGRWTQRSYLLNNTYAGINNLRIRFNWTNNDDGIGTDPSVAVNNILLRDSIPLAGDSVVRTVTLTSPQSPQIQTSGVVLTSPSCGQANGGISGLSVSGGTAPYIVQWLNASGGVVGSGYSLTNVPGGLYIFEVTDANLCKDTAQFNLVSGGSLPPFTLTITKTIFCPGDSSQLCAPANYASYLWSNGATTQCIWVKNAGNYKCTVTDVNNCTGVSNTQVVNLYNVPPVSITIKGDTLSTQGGVSYQWFFNGNPVIGATGPKLIATASGQYAVLVIDENGCQNISEPVNVTVSSVAAIHAGVIRINPNPFEEFIRIRCGVCTTDEISLYDLQGRRLPVSVTQLGDEYVLHTSSLVTGVYVLNVKDTSHRVVKR